MATIAIENEILRVEATTDGGTLNAVVDKRNDEQLLYAGDDPRAWNERDVSIFPFVGRLKGGQYTSDGKVYRMGIHGFVNSMAFAARRISNEEVELSVCDDETTREKFPFRFEYRVRYRVAGDTLTTSLTAVNRDSRVMPFMLGGHQAYRLDAIERESETDTSMNSIVFPDKTYTRATLDASGCFVAGEEPFAVDGPIDLGKATFRQYPTLMLKDVSGKVEVRRPTRTLTYDLGCVPVLALWSHDKFGAYVCVEPWFGQPDTVAPDPELSKKEGIRLLQPNESFTYAYSIAFGERKQ